MFSLITAKIKLYLAAATALLVAVLYAMFRIEKHKAAKAEVENDTLRNNLEQAHSETKDALDSKDFEINREKQEDSIDESKKDIDSMKKTPDGVYESQDGGETWMTTSGVSSTSMDFVINIDGVWFTSGADRILVSDDL